MKVKFISPCKHPDTGDLVWDNKTIIELLRIKSPAPWIALPTLGALVPSDVEVILTDETVEPIDYDEKVDLVGILGMTLYAAHGYEIADEFRKRGVPVIMGGIHASMVPDEVLEHCDSVLIGEAEEMMEQIIRDAEKGNLQKIYQSPGFCDMTKSPIPRWDLLKIKQYMYFNVQTGRGCPYNCEFCSVTNFNGMKYRTRKVEDIVKEIKYLRKLDPRKRIGILDDNILADKKHARKLLKALIPLKVKNWICQASFNKLNDDELLDLMEKAGCGWVFIGIESVSQNSLDEMHKSHINKVAQYKRIINKIYSHGISVFGSFIIGSDAENESIFEDTARFVAETRIPAPIINILTPFPGTRLAERMEKEGRVLKKNDWKYHSGDFVTFKPKNMTKEALEKKYIWLLRELYSYENMYKRLNFLWHNNVFVEKKWYYLFRLDRILLTLYAFFKRDRKRMKFILMGLWHPKIPMIESVISSISFHDWAYRKTFKKKI